MKFENFTAHAAKRLRERTSMSLFELNSMLDQGCTVNLGSKPGINKEHFLFYSQNDDAFFVAVLDSLIGSIITVWLLEYQENLGWLVSNEQKALAKLKANEHQLLPIYEPVGASTCRVSAGYLNSQGEIKNKEFVSLPASDMDIHPLFNQPTQEKMKGYVCQALRDKQIDVANVLWVVIRKGRKGTPTVISLEP